MVQEAAAGEAVGREPGDARKVATSQGLSLTDPEGEMVGRVGQENRWLLV